MPKIRRDACVIHLSEATPTRLLRSTLRLMADTLYRQMGYPPNPAFQPDLQGTRGLLDTYVGNPGNAMFVYADGAKVFGTAAVRDRIPTRASQFPEEVHDYLESEISGGRRVGQITRQFTDKGARGRRVGDQLLRAVIAWSGQPDEVGGPPRYDALYGHSDFTVSGAKEFWTSASRGVVPLADATDEGPYHLYHFAIPTSGGLALQPTTLGGGSVGIG